MNRPVGIRSGERECSTEKTIFGQKLAFCNVINVTKLHLTDEGFDLFASSFFWIVIFAAYKSKN